MQRAAHKPNSDCAYLVWAVIPAAGFGTRLQPVIAILPKELLPAACRPMIELAVQESFDVGLDHTVVVMRCGKEIIRHYQSRRFTVCVSLPTET